MEKINETLIQNFDSILAQKNEVLIEETFDKDRDISYKWIAKNEDLQLINQGININEFSSLYKNRKLDMEYRLLRRLTETQYHSQNLQEYNPNINCFNRYQSILPYTHSQVNLEKFTEEENDDTYYYINANYINTDFVNDKRFIATQGPLKVTIYNFWKMIWKEDIETIIMLCNLKEEDKKIKCDEYWPGKIDTELYYPQESETKNLKIQLDSERDLGNQLTIRQFTLSKKTENQDEWMSRNVKQYQWTGWPDHGVPEDIDSLFFLLNIIIESYCKDKNKIVIHCSAGIGRTGTIIALFNLFASLRRQQIANENSDKQSKISVFGTIRRLREQRWGMVNTLDQYCFIYKILEQLIEKYSLKK